MQISHQLIPKLKSLRLSGILETLDVRNQQAIDDKLSYVEFLQRLLEDFLSFARPVALRPERLDPSTFMALAERFAEKLSGP